MTKQYMDFAPKRASKARMRAVATMPEVQFPNESDDIEIRRPVRRQSLNLSTSGVKLSNTSHVRSAVRKSDGVYSTGKAVARPSLNRSVSTRPVASRPVSSVRVANSSASSVRVANRPASLARPIASRLKTSNIDDSTQTVTMKNATDLRSAALRPAVKVSYSANSKVIRAESRRSNAVKLGEIEDVKFVNTNVEKRALGGNFGLDNSLYNKRAAGDVKAVKARKIGNRMGIGTRNNARTGQQTVDLGDDAKSDIQKEAKAATYAVPKSPFINQDKVKKRPLSKNVYRKQSTVKSNDVKAMSGEKGGETVTIVSKPEKDSKVGVVVAIILTIILGAVAGTVAFLLLPK